MSDEERLNGLSPEFREAIKKLCDCPDDIFKLAKTDFERAVAVEFFKNQEDRNLIKEKMNHIEYLIKAVVGGIGIIGAAFIIRTALEVVLGI